MPDYNKVLDLIYDCVDEINEEQSTKLAKAEDEILFGSGGKLDSLGLVNLIVAIEGRIEDDFDESVTIADEKAMSMKNSPFRTIGTLGKYVHSVLEEL